MSPDKLAKILAKYPGCSEVEALRRHKADKKIRKKRDKALTKSTKQRRGGSGGNGSGNTGGSTSGRHSLMAIITGNVD